MRRLVMNLQINQVIVSNNKNPLKLLIVGIDYKNGGVAVSDLLTTPFKRPTVYKFSEIKQNCEDKIWRIEDHEFDDFLFSCDEDISDEWIRIRDDNYKSIQRLVEDPNRLHRYLFGNSAGILTDLVNTSGRSKKLVQAAINKYFANGRFFNSLLPTYYVCGKSYKGPEEPKLIDGYKVCLKSKPGKPTESGDAYRHITQKDKRNIEAFSKKVKRGQQVILTKLYNKYCMAYFVFKLKPKLIPDSEIAEDFYTVLPRTHRISPRAFKRYIQKVIGPLKWLKMRKGSINFARDNDGKPGMALEGLRGPGSRYEIDSTTADCYIRYEFSDDKLLSIGRPVIYLVIDVMSTMITGVHVCFHGPDWHGASQALFNAFTDKREFCEKYGVKYKEGDWPCDIVCRELTLDRGTENSHINVKSMLTGKIGVTGVNYNAYHRGDAKGTVEKMFDIVQGKVIPEGAGKVIKVPRKEDQHASRKPVYTYKEFMKRLITHIILTNNKRKRIDSHNFEMEKSGVPCRPRDIWNWGIAHATIPPGKKSKDVLRFALLPEEQAVIRDKGIYFRGLYYSSKEVVAKEWLTKAKNIKRTPIKVRYSDINTTYIWCKDPETQEIMQLETTRRSKRYANQLWTQVLARLEILKDQLAREEEDAFVATILTDLELDVMDDEIKKRNKKLTASTAKGIQPDIKERKDEYGDMQKAEGYKDILSDLQESTNAGVPDKPKNKVSNLQQNTSGIF
jgi:putative transposase